MKILIKVTKDILKRSMYCSNVGSGSILTSCALALAVREIFPTAKVNYNAINWDENGEMVIIPHGVGLWVRDFDGLTPRERANLKPMSFEIEVPPCVIDSIGISQVYKILSESKTLELVNP